MQCPAYDIKQSNGEVLVLELGKTRVHFYWQCSQVISWLGNVSPDRFLFTGHIEQLLFKHWATKWVMQNEIELFTQWTVCKQMTESIRIILKDHFLEITLDRIMIFSILAEYLYL